MFNGVLVSTPSVVLVSADIVTAFDAKAVGSRVVRAPEFLAEAVSLIERTDFAAQRVPGQAFIPAPTLVPFVSAGVGRRSLNPEDYVVREYRGHVSAYLKRGLAAACESCALVVYTRDAYFRDPDVTPAEAARIDALSPTHVLVAVLASAGPKPPYPPRTLVRNLAGANHEAAAWSADEIRVLAKASIEYDEVYAPVAD